MKFLADENLFEPIIKYLKEIGAYVLSIREAGLSGISDNEVYKLACNEKRVIITMDKDFTKIFRFPPQKCGGIIVVKIYRRSVSETFKIFKKFYQSLKYEDIIKNLVIITPANIKIHRAFNF